MSAFASLMALSATQTKEQESAVEVALRERQRKEALRRKQQEEKEAKDREMEKQRRLKLFEDQKREEERRKRVAEEKAAKERAMQRREDEERDRLLYGPKKASKMSASSSNGGGSRSAPGKRRSSDESDDDSGPIPLTREELRQRKQELEMKRMYGATKRSAGSSGGSYRKAGRRLPGGAVDITIDPTASSSSATEYKSVKERLIAQQNTLVKLNPNKRDTRTIDEIVTQRAMARQNKTLEGEQAKEFDDWFGTKKKEKEADKKTAVSRPSSVGPLPTPSASQVKKPPLPPTRAAPPPPPRPAAPAYRPPPPRPSVFTKHTNDRAHPNDRVVERAKSTSSKSANKRPPLDPPRSSKDVPRKRARSMTRSESPPPKRRHRTPDSDHLDDEEDVSNTIWQIFGRDRKKYVSKDVFSDDEDMEADARALEREEKASARAAAREEQLALQEERRHEEEKRRRKKERERMGR